MLLQIASVLTPAEYGAVRDAVGAEDLWKDGGATAAGAARRVKSNHQADPTAAPVKGALAKIEMALQKHPVFKSAAQPARFARLLLSRYASGMAYGDHVDAPYIENIRADLSFTLFLSDPADYEGGELVIDMSGHEDRIKLGAGDLVLYPSSAVHHVREVTSGRRLACVGWVKSRIRNSEDRSLLFELERALADIPDGSTRLRLMNIRNNLLRRFGD